ncbi:MAG: hypothetical protein RIQ99_1161, partial [Pseudomonadota bacterium]
ADETALVAVILLRYPKATALGTFQANPR